MRIGIRLTALLASALALLVTVAALAGSDSAASAQTQAGAAKAEPCKGAAPDSDVGGDDDVGDGGDDLVSDDDDAADDGASDARVDESDELDEDFEESEDELDDFDEELDDLDDETDSSDDDFDDFDDDFDAFEDEESDDGCEDRRLRASAPPRFGKRLNVSLVGGAVRVKVAGTRRFVALKGAASVPVGSTIDARRGQVRLTTVTLRSGRQSAVLSRGTFKVLQREGARHLTELRLAGRAQRPCSRARVSRAPGRELLGRGKGHFSTRGRYGAATVRGTGTVWRMVDRCDGTLVTVRRAAVDVRDFARGRTVTVRAGQRYLARPRR